MATAKITDKDILAYMIHRYGTLEKAILALQTPTKRGAKHIRETIPEAGHKGYLVFCHKLSIYTKIGADNIHHASNKCTKLFGPNWSQLKEDDASSLDIIKLGYLWTDVKRFAELLKTLPI